MANTDETLNEDLTPSEQAKRLGLTYGGFGGWVDSNRVVRARTVDGKLVKVDDAAEGGEKNMGRLTVLTFPGDLMHTDRHQISEPVKAKFNVLLQAILKFEGTFVIFTPRNNEENVARYLKDAGITSNVKLVPFGSADPNKKRGYVEKKIKAGFREIEYFDQDKKAVSATEGLKAPFNKLNLKLNTHVIPPLSKTLTGTAPKSEEGESEKKAA
jgi:hypothetical protein